MQFDKDKHRNNQEVGKLPDKTLTCRDCSEEFVFTEGEQDFYREKGFENEPVRCPSCRKIKKQDRYESGGGGGRTYSGGRSFGGASRRGGERR
jgi:hypothetical protein